jgi:hypothetical protein
MRFILNAAVLLLLPGDCVPAHGQEVQPEKQQQPVRPAQQQAGQPQGAKPAQHPRPARRQAKSSQRQTTWAQQAKSPQHAVRHERISDEKFRASFGSGHTFHVSRSDFNGASRRFQYGGFSWSLVNPWPTGWLYTDSLYVDYVNEGYFLCAPVHPGVYLSLNIS